MLDFSTTNVRLARAASDVELGPDGISRAGSHTNFQGTARFTFDRPVRRARAALQGFRFETKDDHHLRKIKIEINNPGRVDGRAFTVGVEAHFGDSSPQDDTYQFMTLHLLAVADTE